MVSPKYSQPSPPLKPSQTSAVLSVPSSWNPLRSPNLLNDYPCHSRTWPPIPQFLDIPLLTIPLPKNSAPATTPDLKQASARIVVPALAGIWKRASSKTPPNTTAILQSKIPEHQSPELISTVFSSPE
ncbi:MAG: hypothetical protein NTY98_08880 [Verrucomicrobia bacterium]|nr:hypothetical protein [Verrucomicrobiota bacterium]